MKVDTWNILHDGIIKNIEGAIPGTVSFTIEIDYLTKMISPDLKCLIFEISNCSKLQYSKNYSQPAITSLLEIAKEKPWITGAEMHEDILKIYCTEGLLEIRYQDEMIYLEDHSPLSAQKLDDISRTYWDNFGKTNGD